MYKLYCLVDPRNNKPFYVGVTKCKLPTRLCQHVKEVEYGCFRLTGKQQLMNDIKLSGKKVRIRLIFATDLPSVDFYENFFYDMFISQGFTLFQRKSSFNYAQKEKINLRYISKHQQLKKYMQLRYKNILILIW